MKTLFQKIIDREIPSNIVYEDTQYICIHDINPQKNTHILIIPKKPIANFVDASNDINDQKLVKGMLDIARLIIAKNNLKGCNLLLNSGENHGQEIPHIHLHLMSDDILI